jgi:pimeloyl-ACP methyl ester carboxylesterase
MTVDRSDSLYRSVERTGAEVVVYGYRGIGFSSGTPDVMAFRDDSLRIYDAVAAANPRRKVVVFGFSLGTAMASSVASQRQLAGLILAGTIASARDEFPVYMRAAGVDPSITATLGPDADAVQAFDEVANVSRSKAPLLMLHGESNTLVPIAQGRKVFAASPSSEKQFVALTGIGHNGTAGAAESLRAVEMFLKKATS